MRAPFLSLHVGPACQSRFVPMVPLHPRTAKPRAHAMLEPAIAFESPLVHWTARHRHTSSTLDLHRAQHRAFAPWVSTGFSPPLPLPLPRLISLTMAVEPCVRAPVARRSPPSDVYHQSRPWCSAPCSFEREMRTPTPRPPLLIPPASTPFPLCSGSLTGGPCLLARVNVHARTARCC